MEDVHLKTVICMLQSTKPVASVWLIPCRLSRNTYRTCDHIANIPPRIHNVDGSGMCPLRLHGPKDADADGSGSTPHLSLCARQARHTETKIHKNGFKKIKPTPDSGWWGLNPHLIAQEIQPYQVLTPAL